jgi:hypothetical protein
VRLLDAIRKAVDPRGPLGEVLSPSEVFKDRLGLPIAAPHTARAVLAASKEQVEHALAAPRFASLDESAPPNRVRQVSAYVEEHWSPVYAKTDSTDLATILVTSQQQIGWTVTQRESEQSRLARRAQQNAEEFAEVLQSMQIQASDEFYVGYYETIPGNDPVILDGEILRGEATYDENGKMTHDGIVRGGTYIRGRKHYNAATKGFITWDKGAWAEHERAQAEYASRGVRNVRRALEDCQNALPLWRPVGINFRRDRRSAV